MILYTTNCSKCRILESVLTRNEIPYIKNYDLNKVVNAGFREMPVLELGDGTLLDFDEAVKHITQVRGIF